MSYDAIVEYMKLNKYTDDQIKRAIIFLDNKEYYEVTTKINTEFVNEVLDINEKIVENTFEINKQIAENVVEFKKEEVKEVIEIKKEEVKEVIEIKKEEIKEIVEPTSKQNKINEILNTNNIHKSSNEYKARLIDVSLDLKPQELKIIILNSKLSGKEIISNLELLKEITPSYKKNMISTIDDIIFKITDIKPTISSLDNKKIIDTPFVSNTTKRESINDKAFETIYEFNHLENVLNNIKNNNYTILGLNNVKENISNLKTKYANEPEKLRFLEVVEINVFNSMLKSMKSYNNDYKTLVENGIDNAIINHKIDIKTIKESLNNFEQTNSDNKLSQNPILIPVIGVLINELLASQLIQQKNDQLKREQEIINENNKPKNNVEKNIALSTTGLLILKDVIENKNSQYKELVSYFKDSTYFDFKNLTDLIKSKDLSLINKLFDKKIDDGLDKKTPIEESLLKYTAFGKISSMIDGLFEKEPGLDFIKESLSKTLGDSLINKEFTNEKDLSESLDDVSNNLINQLALLQDENPIIFTNPNVLNDVNKISMQLLETKLHNQLTELHNQEIDKEIKSDELNETIEIQKLLKESKALEQSKINEVNRADSAIIDNEPLKREILQSFGEKNPEISESIKKLSSNFENNLIDPKTLNKELSVREL